MHRRILLIEKDDDLKDFFGQIFFKAGHETFTYDNESCIDSLSDDQWSRFELIVIDECEQPETFCQKVEERCRKLNMSTIPILAIVGDGVDITEILDYKFSECIIKDDFNLEKLTREVEDLLEG